MNTAIKQPEFRELAQEDIRSVLTRNHVGRIAFLSGDEVELRPLHYVYSEGRIYGRTSPEANLIRPGRIPNQVVFEVDEVQAVFHWTSVIVRGSFEIVHPDESPDEWFRAAALLRRVIKPALREGDPVPERNVIFRITIGQATGRASS
jgi:uncharacterized protein